MMKKINLILILLLIAMPFAHGDEKAPWGHAEAQEIEYKPNKVVYDIALKDQQAFELALDRASYLSKIYNADPFEASIVMVLHGDEINYFAIENFDKYKKLMERARSLTLAGVIKFHMCQIAARGHGYEPADIHGFVNVVPMADAEIVRLQREEGYAYMR